MENVHRFYAFLQLKYDYTISLQISIFQTLAVERLIKFKYLEIIIREVFSCKYILTDRKVNIRFFIPVHVIGNPKMMVTL